MEHPSIVWLEDVCLAIAGKPMFSVDILGLQQPGPARHLLHAVPKPHEGASQEEAEGSSKLCYQGSQGVDELLGVVGETESVAGLGQRE